MKWVSRSVMVARPVTLYVRDVPILWLPFIFQDMRPGRHSGILIPQFGINDLVRPTPGYNRQVANLGYYWAPNDYLDFTARLDWFANRYVQYGVTGQYRLLNRFLDGTVGFNEQRESDGGSGFAVRWDHRQQFDLSTSLNVDFNYASNTNVVRDNAIDPLQNTQQITSSAQLLQAVRLGDADPGREPPPGHQRRRRAAAAAGADDLPGAVGPGLGHHLVAGAQLHQQHDLRPEPGFPVPGPARRRDRHDRARDASSRVTALNFDTPFRFGSFNWQNSIQATDQTSTGLETVELRIDDPASDDPADSITVRRTFSGDFESSVDWNTGINLPDPVPRVLEASAFARHLQHDERAIHAAQPGHQRRLGAIRGSGTASG